MKTLIDKINMLLGHIEKLTEYKVIAVHKTYDNSLPNKMQCLADLIHDSLYHTGIFENRLVSFSSIHDGEVRHSISPAFEGCRFNYSQDFFENLAKNLTTGIARFYSPDNKYFIITENKELSLEMIGEKTKLYIENIIQEVTGILGIEAEIEELSKITNEKQTENQDTKKELDKIIQQKEQLNKEITKLSSFNLEERISTLDVKQKAKLLGNIWLDNDFNDIKNIIIKQGFDANYYSTKDDKLWNLAFLQGSDIKLFKLLVSNGLNFNQTINNKSLLQVILDKNDNAFTYHMMENINKESINILLLDLLYKDDAVNLGKIFKYNKELVNYKFQGCSLLHVAIKTHSYNTQKLLLDFNSALIDDKGDINITPMYLALKLDDLKSISILEPYDTKALEKDKYDKIIIDAFTAIIQLNTDGMSAEEVSHKINKIMSKEEVNLILNEAISKNKTDVILKLVRLLPEHLEDLAKNERPSVIKQIVNDEVLNLYDSDGNSLLHLACKYHNKVLLEALLAKTTYAINEQNNFGETALHILLRNDDNTANHLKMVEMFIQYKPNIYLTDSQDISIVDLAETKDIISLLTNLIKESSFISTYEHISSTLFKEDTQPEHNNNEIITKDKKIIAEITDDNILSKSLVEVEDNNTISVNDVPINIKVSSLDNKVISSDDLTNEVHFKLDTYNDIKEQDNPIQDEVKISIRGKDITIHNTIENVVSHYEEGSSSTPTNSSTHSPLSSFLEKTVIGQSHDNNYAKSDNEIINYIEEAITAEVDTMVNNNIVLSNDTSSNISGDNINDMEWEVI